MVRPAHAMSRVASGRGVVACWEQGRCKHRVQRRQRTEISSRRIVFDQEAISHHKNNSQISSYHEMYLRTGLYGRHHKSV